MEEVMMMDSRVIRPATDVKEYLQPVRKTIKKRENKRLEWERNIDKVNTMTSKMGRSDKENAALAKAEEELARTSDVGFQNDIPNLGPSANTCPSRHSSLQIIIFEKPYPL